MCFSPRDFGVERQTQRGIVHILRSSMRSMHAGKNQSLGSMRSVNQQTRPAWLRARRRPTVLIRKDSPTQMLNTDLISPC